MGSAHLEKWRSLVEDFRDQARRLEREEQANCAACVAQARAKVAEAQQFMETSGIGEALCALVWDVRRFAAWSCNSHARPVPPEYSDLDIVVDHMKDFAVSFTYRGRRQYGITFKEVSTHPDAHGDRHGEAFLSTAGAAVFGIAMVNRAGAEYDDWRPTTVEAFRPGDWIPDLLAMHAEARRAKAAYKAKRQDEIVSKRAEMISLE